MNTALYRATVSDRPPASAFGTYMYDRGPAWSGSRYHLGVDTPVAQGTSVYASGTGRVVRVSRTPQIGYIWIIDIAYQVPGGTVRVQTHHMSRIDVNVGDWVSLMTLIGLSGGARGTMGAGNSTGPHVHTQTYFNDSLVDPASVLNSRSQIAGGGTTPIGDDVLNDDDKNWIRLCIRQEVQDQMLARDGQGNSLGYTYFQDLTNKSIAIQNTLDNGGGEPGAFTESDRARLNATATAEKLEEVPYKVNVEQASKFATVNQNIQNVSDKIDALPTEFKVTPSQ